MRHAARAKIVSRKNRATLGGLQGMNVAPRCFPFQERASNAILCSPALSDVSIRSRINSAPPKAENCWRTKMIFGALSLEASRFTGAVGCGMVALHRFADCSEETCRAFP